MYTIYHIPNIKIGCTKNLKERMRAQGFTEWEILEEHTCVYEASDRELQLQEEYGFRIDSTPYWKVVAVDRSPFGIKGAAANKKRWDAMLQDPNHQRKASAAGHLAKLKKGTYDKIGKMKRKFTFEDAEQIRRLCKDGMFQRDAAKLYGVSQRTINMIVNYITYKKK